MTYSCGTQNTFAIYEADNNHKVYPGAIFKCIESSSFLAKKCLSRDCCPFSIDIEHDDEFVSGLQENNMFLRLKKPCEPTFLCCARPVIEVFISENGVEGYFGKVNSKWNLIDISFNVYDK